MGQNYLFLYFPFDANTMLFYNLQNELKFILNNLLFKILNIFYI